MKRILTLITLLLLWASASAQVWGARPGVSMTAGTNGFYEWLPSSYNGTTKLPVIIFLHGLGEVGNGTSDLVNITNLGLPMFIKNYGFPYQAIVIAPQFNSAWPAWFVTDGIINYVRNNYAVDTNRIYLTGLSMGASTVLDYFNDGRASKIAAIAPLCTSYGWMATAGANLKSAGVATYFFHGDQDADFTDWHNSTSWLTNLNAAPSISPPAKMDTLEGYSHNIWNTVYDYSYIPPYNNGNNIYQWMLAQSRSVAPPNQAPTANAGADQHITLPTTSVILSGSAVDADGTVTSSTWTQVSGPTSTIVSPSSFTTNVTGLSTAGTYVYRLTAVDNNSASAADDITVVVNAVASNVRRRFSVRVGTQTFRFTLFTDNTYTREVLKNGTWISAPY